jgi:hypothetical protein
MQGTAGTCLAFDECLLAITSWSAPELCCALHRQAKGKQPGAMRQEQSFACMISAGWCCTFSAAIHVFPGCQMRGFGKLLDWRLLGCLGAGAEQAGDHRGPGARKDDDAHWRVADHL